MTYDQRQTLKKVEGRNVKKLVKRAKIIKRKKGDVRSKWDRQCKEKSKNKKIGKKCKEEKERLGAAIAQWIHLRLPSCRPGFDSRRFYHL